VTAPLFAEGAGAPSEAANRLVEVSSNVGYGPRWLDLGSGDVIAEGRKFDGVGPGAGDDLPGHA
jgi:hypothetical protein